MTRENVLRVIATSLVCASILCVSGISVYAGNVFGTRAVGGVAVDANGVIKEITVSERDDYLKRLRQDTEQAAGELGLPVELRKVSLRGLEAALQDSVDNQQGRITDSLRYLAGLQRIQFILVYPEQNDIVIAGPGEGWKVDNQGNLVGLTTGQPVLQLEDLLIAFRSVEAARREGISVSIDPTAEGRRNFEQFMSRQTTFNPRVIEGIEQAMGPQVVSYTGIPANTHFARVLAAADYRMKRLAMDLDEPPIPGMPSFLDLLNQRRRTPANAMPRWWLACNYEPLARSEDKLVWELRGPGVKALTEDEFIQADGTVRGSGQQDPTAKQWADSMTAKYAELAKNEPIFAELRNLMDMCIVAALVEREDLCGLAGGASFPLLTGRRSGLAVENWNPLKTLKTECSFLKVGRNYVITASGGVQIDSWEVAARSEVDPATSKTHGKAAKPADSSWWWN